ncbi:MAG: CPBP family intramembrane metalloprotease [Bacteroidota bacterium]|nr:CPBP family intramembrane metalloprotease [Bacteroidota bacterium]
MMILGPAFSGMWLTYLTEGKGGLRTLMKKMSLARVRLKWYIVTLLLPPLLILFLLSILKVAFSNSFTPNFFFLGFLFGIPAGFLEEIGWSGFAYPHLSARYGFKRASIILGFIWGMWHLPVIDFLGAASPHGVYWPFFALSFCIAMAAMRIIISWIFSNSGSVLMTQLAHAVSTGSLVIFGPSPISPENEAIWYFLYGIMLWMVASLILRLGNFPKTQNVDS